MGKTRDFFKKIGDIKGTFHARLDRIKDRNVKDLSGRSTGEGIGYPLEYSGLENSMDCIVHGVAKSRTRLTDFHFTSHLSPAQRAEGLRDRFNWLFRNQSSEQGISCTPQGRERDIYLVFMW